MDGGLVLIADDPGMHLWSDARIRVERQDPSPYSYDGQFIETSRDGDNSVATFTSFARFEGRMTLDTRLGRLGAGRTRQHWGPAYHHPLIIGQWSQPYSHVDWTLEWKTFRVRTLWGQLAVDGAGRFRKDTASRSIYAHRYEWTPCNWLSLGATEALILNETEDPLAFAPFIPLFMAKGQGVEDRTNGELAFDADIRPVAGWRLYGEFLIDDMSEPASLFNDFWKNKWAVVVGTQIAFTRFRSVESGLITEVSRVEPWVYTHYKLRTAQATHLGVPLGDPSGPNSLSWSTTSYLSRGPFSFSTGVDWIRKGIDLGSETTDTLSSKSRLQKGFLVESTDLVNLRLTTSVSLRFFDVRVGLGWSAGEGRALPTRSPASFEAGLSSRR